MKKQMKCLLLFGVLLLGNLQPVAAGPCVSPPSLVGLALATLFCMAPKVDRGRSRSSRGQQGRTAGEEVEMGLFGGGWIDPRAGTQPDSSHLLEVNQNCMAPLGVSWGCDFISMEVAPSALECFALSWEVGGSLQRGPKSQFPGGLEISSKPYTLRLRSILHDEMNAAHEELLIEAGQKLRKALTSTGKTGHPLLAPHPDKNQQALALAMQERWCSASQLTEALNQALNWEEWQLFICRYGMKAEGQDFFPFFCKPNLAQKSSWALSGAGLLGRKLQLTLGPKPPWMVRWQWCTQTHL